jgi:cytoskeletal protein CcmA (bactofilin family)
MKKRGVTSFESPDRLNVIVEGSKVIGDMITDSNLRVDGDVMGNVTSASKVVVGENGSITGDLICADADIEGRVSGVMKIDGLLSLRSKAVIDGEITTSKFEIEEGAHFSGNCVMNSFPSKPLTKPTTTQEDTVH